MWRFRKEGYIMRKKLSEIGKYGKKLTAIIAAAALAMSTLTACGTSAESTSSTDATKTVSAVTTHSSKSGKTETVYVIKDGAGNVSETIVSEWLKNPDGSESLADVSNLSDIEVVKGDATYTEGEDGELTWNTSGGDVYYEGTSTAELPVDVNVSCTLDGKSVTSDELEGATGHVVVTFEYENNTGEEVESEYGNYTVYQPFIMISGFIADNDEVSNIEVENGSYTNDGTRSIIYGMGLPGLSE